MKGRGTSEAPAPREGRVAVVLVTLCPQPSASSGCCCLICAWVMPSSQSFWILSAASAVLNWVAICIPFLPEAGNVAQLVVTSRVVVRLSVDHGLGSLYIWVVHIALVVALREVDSFMPQELT